MSEVEGEAPRGEEPSRDRSPRGDRGDRDKDRDRDRSRRKRSRSRERSRRERSPRREGGREERGGRSERERGGRRRSRERDEFDPPQFDEHREANRDDYTIFVHKIHPKVDDRDLFDFFSHVGRVLDIRLIRDQRTLKSKGLAYVEFWEQQSVPSAVSLNGCELGGFPISIQITQSEQEKTTELPDIPMRLYVGNLHKDVGDEDLRPMFEAFGALQDILIAKEHTGESKGFAYITYKKEVEAKQALENLDGLELAGMPMKVGVVDVAQTSLIGGGGVELDDSGGLNMTAQGRQALMAKLSRGMPGAPNTPMPMPGMPSMPQQTFIQPTTCLVVKNMFVPAEETDPNFHLDIAEDITDECAKSQVKPLHLHVDKDHPQGHVFMRFTDIPSCQKIAATFHGRWFAKRQITAEFVPEQTYISRFPQ